jgi:hypothetical protein
MAVGKASNFTIYQEEFFGGLIETLAQSTAALATVGIGLQTRQLVGDYERESLIKAIAGIISRRDTTSVEVVVDSAVEMGELISAKLNRKLGPVAQTLDAWRKAGLPFVADWDPSGMRGLSSYLGAQAAKATEIEMLNSALLACRTFLENANSNSQRHTIAANGTMTTAAMVSGLGLMGDASDRVVAWVMHSKPFFDLMQHQITVSAAGSDLAFGVISEAAPKTLNRPVYVSDSASLVVAGSPALYRTIGLTAGAVKLINSEEQTLVSDVITGLENIVGRMQGEFAYNLGLAGARWNIAGGGANPDAAALGTSSNWVQTATSMKDGPGVVIISG